MTNLITAPFAWIMRIFFEFTHSYGLTLIFFSLVVKLVMLPFQLKSKKSMVRMGRLTGKQKELEKKYANNKQKYQEELQKLYADEGINPMGSCLWSLIPIAIIWPLYYIVREPMAYFMRLSSDTITAVRDLAMSLNYVPVMTGDKFSYYEQINLAQFVSDHWESFSGKFEGLMQVDFNFLGIDLTATPGTAFSGFVADWSHIALIAIPIISGVLSWLLSKITTSSNGQQTQGSMKGMMLMMPLMSIYIGFILPASLGIYWIANSAFSIIQEATLGKYFNKKIQAEEDERQAKREAARQLRMEEAKRQALEEKNNPKAQQKKPQQKAPEKKKPSNPTNEAGRVGERPYARGRSYVENRYEDKQ